MGVFCAWRLVVNVVSRPPGQAWRMAAVSISRPNAWAMCGHGAMIGNMGSGVGSDAVAGGVAGLGAGGVVSRPRLFERLGVARATVVSAPAGSGKTVLLRSWISEAGLSERVAWAPVGRGERDPQRFWLSVLDALRQTGPGSVLVRPVTAAPDLDGWAIAERLLTDLAPLEDRVWLVIDDVHELGPDHALRQLELLVMRAPQGCGSCWPPGMTCGWGCTDCGWRAGWPRSASQICGSLWLRRGSCWTPPGCGCPRWRCWWSGPRGGRRGCGWRALSLAGHPDPARFVAEFSGTERTVAEYLLAEVLDPQGEPVRRLLLLRTSIVERVNGELADLLSGDEGGERVLQDLEAAGAFVVSLDVARSWFRYHQMFAGLLQLELRRTAPGKVAALHSVAAGWFAGHGFGVEAVRHAQAARDWGLAVRLLARHWRPG